MLEALNSIVSFLSNLVSYVFEMQFYSAAFFKFLWQSVNLSLDFLRFIPEPFSHFAYITLIVTVLCFIFKVVF